MKRILVLSYLFISFICHSQQGGIIGKGQIDINKIEFFRKNYQWNKEYFFVVSFRQPKSRCYYDNFRNLGKTESAILKFGESVEEKSIRNIFVSSDEKRVKSYLDFKTTYSDVENLVLNTFFEKVESCFGLVVINRKGQYMSLAGEYVTKDIDNFIRFQV
ncbi:MAG: hypothetical protein HKP48_09885 [Winogradskyella sp.]|uniref:hypothetical protein n=1 Tax=Winogradskyella sp. TaxID=1883156 RepID=UPI0017B01F88|nr:hypothetical protein [Winogradskyella sp.]MBT8245328.1 hypothetical protein [Winogradskyella sp.]NNK23577.1 hypothetical protein [Winogradskyella sp.]